MPKTRDVTVSALEDTSTFTVISFEPPAGTVKSPSESVKVTTWLIKELYSAICVSPS